VKEREPIIDFFIRHGTPLKADDGVSWETFSSLDSADEIAPLLKALGVKIGRVPIMKREIRDMFFPQATAAPTFDDHLLRIHAAWDRLEPLYARYEALYNANKTSRSRYLELYAKWKAQFYRTRAIAEVYRNDPAMLTRLKQSFIDMLPTAANKTHNYKKTLEGLNSYISNHPEFIALRATAWQANVLPDHKS
jgi:hypothetical protein